MIWQRNTHVVEAFGFNGTDKQLWAMLEQKSLTLEPGKRSTASRRQMRMPDFLRHGRRMNSSPRTRKVLLKRCRANVRAGLFPVSSTKSVPRSAFEVVSIPALSGCGTHCELAGRRGGLKTAIIRSSWMPCRHTNVDCQPYLGGSLEAKPLLEELPIRKDSIFGFAHRREGIYFAGRESVRWVDSSEYGIPFARQRYSVV